MRISRTAVESPLSVSDIFTNSIFRNIVISLLAMLGLYIIASVIFVSNLPYFYQTRSVFLMGTSVVRVVI